MQEFSFYCFDVHKTASQWVYKTPHIQTEFTSSIKVSNYLHIHVRVNKLSIFCSFTGFFLEKKSICINYLHQNLNSFVKTFHGNLSLLKRVSLYSFKENSHLNHTAVVFLLDIFESINLKTLKDTKDLWLLDEWDITNDSGPKAWQDINLLTDWEKLFSSTVSFNTNHYY